MLIELNPFPRWEKFFTNQMAPRSTQMVQYLSFGSFGIMSGSVVHGVKVKVMAVGSSALATAECADEAGERHSAGRFRAASAGPAGRGAPPSRSPWETRQKRQET